VRQSPNIRLSNHVLGMPPNVQPSDRPPASEESVSLVERARHCTFTQKSALLVGGRIVETPRPETRGVTRMKRIVLEILFAAIVLVVRTSDSRAEVFESPAPSSKVSIGGASICKGPDGTYANINGCGALDAMTPSPQLTPPPAAPTPTPTPQQSPQPRRILLQNQPKCDDARLNHLVLQAWNEFWAKIIQSPIILPQYRETYIANLSPLNLQISESVSQPGSAVCRGLTAFQILATGTNELRGSFLSKESYYILSYDGAGNLVVAIPQS